MLLSGQLLRGLVFILIAAIALTGVACNGGGGGGDLKLQGAGATFPNPLYQKWINEYGKLHANVKIDYQSIGSGGGSSIVLVPGLEPGIETGTRLPREPRTSAAKQATSFMTGL